MTETDLTLALFSWAELREYIHHILCRSADLLAEQSPLAELPLIRAGRRCGIQFILQGPRNLRLSAIWASDLNVIYFYDANGERGLKVALRYRLTRTADAA